MTITVSLHPLEKRLKSSSPIMQQCFLQVLAASFKCNFVSTVFRFSHVGRYIPDLRCPLISRDITCLFCYLQQFLVQVGKKKYILRLRLILFILLPVINLVIPWFCRNVWRQNKPHCGVCKHWSPISQILMSNYVSRYMCTNILDQTLQAIWGLQYYDFSVIFQIYAAFPIMHIYMAVIYKYNSNHTLNL